MAEPPAAPTQQPKVIEAVVDAAKRAFDPSTDDAARQPAHQKYNELIESTETWDLLPALNALIKPNVLPPWLKEPLMRTLTHIPLRKDGVRGTMEFVFSVHPSSGDSNSGAAEPQKTGASITREAVAIATKLLSSVPSDMTPQEWFNGLSEQFFALFDGDAGSDLAKTAAQIVGFGILGKKQLGAPGAPGWNAFVQPLLEHVNPSLKSSSGPNSALAGGTDDEVIDLSGKQVLVTAQALQQSLRRLETLILSNPSPGLCKRVLKPAALHLWTIASMYNPPKETEQHFCKPARNLIQTYMRLFGNSDTIMPLIQNLLCKGSVEGEDPVWRYRLTSNGGMEIATEPAHASSEIDLNWSEIDSKAAALAEAMNFTCSTEEVSSVFLELLKRWIQTASSQGASAIDIKISEQRTEESPVQNLIAVTVLQKLMEKAPDKLVSHFDQLLNLVCQVLRADGRSPLDDDLVAVVLSLLNLIITAPAFQKSDMGSEELTVVETSLDRIGGQERPDISTTARNLGLFLKYRGDMNGPDDTTVPPTARQIEDRRTYNLAMTYITGETGNTPPVVSEGLNLLSTLILAGSPILDITAVTVLMSNLLKDNEDYINLRVIKIFTQLAGKHPKSTLQEILDHYLDVRESASTDVRLRFGEALVQVIERLGETFSGDVAQQAGETLLSIAGRRGYRPKTMAKQTREEKLRKLKEEKQGGSAEDEDNGDDTMEDEETTEEERARNDILAQIVQGWESKRGSEDVRMRTSALSIFGVAIETSIGGMGPTLVSAGVDLSINVLAMEPELETAILRRAAILVILSFVKALDKAKESGRVLGFGLTGESRADIQRTLEYVAATDNDGLVQQHARDVVESLENWEAASLLGQRSERGPPGLTRLAGLRVNPDGDLVDGSGQRRPRIEEVE